MQEPQLRSILFHRCVSFSLTKYLPINQRFSIHLCLTSFHSQQHLTLHHIFRDKVDVQTTFMLIYYIINTSIEACENILQVNVRYRHFTNEIPRFITWEPSFYVLQLKVFRQAIKKFYLLNHIGFYVWRHFIFEQ